MLVTVVPILAPMTMGMAHPTVRASAATRPTTMDVVLEELWIRDVDSSPIIKPMIGLVVVLINNLLKSGIEINRKILADMAVKEPEAFAQLVTTAKSQIEG